MAAFVRAQSSTKRKKPALVGTSNTRQADPYGMVRYGNRQFHTPRHRCCNAVDQARFLSAVSIPGLSTKNMDTHTVPTFPHACNQRYGGLTLRGVIRAVASDPSFNGHFCLWFMGNDADFIMKYEHRYNVELAVQHYEGILAELFQGVHLERIYLVTPPLRMRDFTDEHDFGCAIFPYKIEFNSELRRVFKEGNKKINGCPVTLVDLNVCIPEKEMWKSDFYCDKEKEKIHINKEYYLKFLDFLHNFLESHGGLSDQSTQLTATTLPSPSLSLHQHVEQKCFPVSALPEAQHGDRTPLSLTPTDSVVVPSVPSVEHLNVPESTPVGNTKKPKKSRGKHSKSRNLDTLWTMKMNCQPTD